MVCKWYEICPLRKFEEEGRLNKKWAEKYCKTESNWKNCKRYQLEEKAIKHPNNMLPNGEIDENLI